MFTSAFIAAKIHAIESDKKTPWVIVVDDVIVEVAAGRTAARELGIKGKISKYDASLVEFDEPSVSEEAEVVTTTATTVDAGVEGNPVPEVVVATVKPKLDVLRRSLIERPTKRVWFIAEELLAADPTVKRSAIIAECVKRGIAFYTARTQYQQYFETLREQRTREASNA